MSISRVQGNAVASSGTVTSQSGTLGSGVTSGNLLVAAITTGATGNAVTPPSGWTQAVFNQPNSPANCETGLWWAIVGTGGVSAGQTSWTFSFATAHNVYIIIEEWNSSTGWRASPVDVTAVGNTAATATTATTIVSGTTSTTTQASELWVASLTYSSGVQTESSITSGWTKDLETHDTSNNHTATMLYQVASSTGAAACQYTITTAENWAGCVATFKPVVVTTSSRTIPATAALQSSQLARTAPASAALQSQQNPRNVPSNASLQSVQNPRIVPSYASLANELSRTIPASAALTNSGSRTIPVTTALMSVQNPRTIPAQASLTVTNSRTIPTSVALYQPAVFYASNVASTIGGLTQSDQMSTLAGGTETSVNVTMPSSGSNLYVELLAQGGTSSGTPALPSPTGKGWSIALAGNTILAGNWSSIFTLAKSGTSMSSASLLVRWYRRTMDGVCYAIGVSTLSSQTFSTTKTIYTTPSVLASWPWQFVSGDVLYMDAFVFNGSTAWASDVFTVYVSNSASAGVYNDGTIIAPVMITTPAGLSCPIGASNFQTGSTLPVLNQSFTLADALDQRSILTLTGEDTTGTLAYQRGMPVQLSDHDQGLLYTGYVNSDKVSKPAAGNSNAQLEHMLTFMDNHYLVDKRANQTNYLNWAAGDMVCDFVQQTLSQEGITGQFALESDYTPATFGQGTLSGTVATTTTSPFTYAPNTAQPPITSNTGDLELVRAGTQFTLTESVTSDFSSGTLTNMVASNNSLSPTTVNAIKMQSFLPYTYGVELAPSQISVSGGTANVSGSANLSGSASVSGFASLSTSYTPSGSIFISGGNPGESASFSGFGASINPSGTVSSSGSATASGTVNSSGPVTGISATPGYQPKYRSSVQVNGQYYKVTTADASVVDNRIDAVIWTGTMTIGTNDTLNYDIWISSTSPMYQAGVELFFDDGTTLTEYVGQVDTNFSVGQWDQNLLSVLPIQDLSDYCKDAWYTRNIDLADLVGRNIIGVSIFNSGNQAGTYDVYIKNCYLGSHSGSPFFGTSATAPAVNPPTVSAIGAYVVPATVLAVVPVYLPAASSRVSPAYSISSVGLVQNSTITWVASTPTIGPTVTAGTLGAATTAGQVALFCSYDGTTWLPCTNNQALPGLPAGANVSGVSLYLMEMFSGGQDPTAIPSLRQVVITINSAANQTTSDVVASYGTSSAWNSGTLAGLSPNSNGDLALGTTSYSWSNLNNMTFVGGDLLDNDLTTPTQSVSSGAYTVTSYGDSDGATWTTSRFNFIAAAQNFTAEADFKLTGSGVAQNECGFVYRQTYWGSPDNSYAYYIRIMNNPSGSAGGTSVSFGYGINTPPSTPTGADYTVVAKISETINLGTTYHLKLVVHQNRHTIYWNHGSSPIIDIIDNTYTQAGNIGFRTYMNAGNTNNGTATISNFTITNTFAGTWTSPSISLSSLGTCGNTQVSWGELTAQGNEQTTAVVLASLDGGTTWTQCVNGATTPTAVIPGLTSGTNVSGKSLLIQVTLYSTGFLTQPILNGLFVRVCGNYGTVTGTRISPALNLSPVGYVASSNVMYNANIPTSTSVVVQTTQDLASFHTVGNNGAGETLPYWTNQPSATQDLFSSNTSSNYTNTSKSGGSAASVLYETANSRITLSGGASALYLNSSISCTDVDLLCDMDVSDTGGLVWRKVDASNYYELGVYDNYSTGGFTNQLRLYKVSSGTRTLLGNASSIVFTSGTFHRIRVKMKGGLINVYWDGQCVQSYLDTSPLGAGACGLRNDGGASRYYQLWIQPLGSNLSGQVLYTKVTMSTSDPSMMPQLFTLVACVRGPSIGTGATISQLHPVTTPFATYYSTEMDTLTQASSDTNLGPYFWYVDKWKQLHFAPRLARPGAFPVQSVADSAGNYSGYLLYQPQVTVQSSADLYRGQQIITNVSQLVTPPPETKVADGSTTSWTMGYPLYSAPTITINGQPATVGVQGIDNGRQFYWQPGSASISYDSSLPKLPAGTILVFTYVGQSTVNVVLNNSASQAAQAALELNSGIVAEIESALNSTTQGMTTAQATTFGNGLLARFGSNNTIEMIGTTLYPGLAPGTVIPLFLQEVMGTWNAQLPVVKVTTTAYQGQNGIIWLYSVDATNGANLNNWSRVFFSK